MTWGMLGLGIFLFVVFAFWQLPVRGGFSVGMYGCGR